MTLLRPRLVAALVALASLLPARGGTGAEVPRYRLIVNLENPVSALTRAQASALFLRKVMHWPEGTPARPVDQHGDAAVREAFSREVHGRPAAAVRVYWQQVIFSGRGLPPPEKASDAEVIAYVEGHPGAIGYVSAAAPLAEVKPVVLVAENGR